MTEEDFRRSLKTYTKVKFGSQKKAAETWGISPAFLSDVLNGKRDPGAKLLTALGFRRVVSYEHVNYERDPESEMWK